MMKFNVEDKVRIKKDIPVGSELRYIDFLEGMKEDADNEVVFTIKEADKKDNAYSIKEINDIDNGWWICEEWIELVRNDDKILFAKVKPDAIIPTKREEDAGWDIYCCSDEESIVIYPHETKMIPTGLATAFDSKYVAILKERGSTGTKGIGQRSGIIDSGYRNEIFVPITNHNNKPLIITKETNQTTLEILAEDYIIYSYSKAICQMILLELPQLQSEEISYEELKNIKSERGMTCLGQSGK